MMQKGRRNIDEVPYCFARSCVKLQGHTAQKIVGFDPNWGVSGLKLQFEFTNGYQMMQKAWRSIEDVPYCFARSSVKFQDRTALQIVKFDPKLGISGL